MRKSKEIVTKSYGTYQTGNSYVVVDTVKQYYYDNEYEKNKHKKEMIEKGYQDSGQVQENIGTCTNPVYVLFGSYYKREVKDK